MGHVQKRSGKAKPWVARYRTPSGEERSQSFRRQVDAKQFIANAEADMDRGDWVDPKRSSITLARFWQEQRLRPGKRGVVQPSTLAKWDTVWKEHVAPALGSRALSSISRQDVRDMVASIPSPWQGVEALKLVRMLFYRAIDDGRIKNNAAARIEAPRTTRTKPRVLKPVEIAAVVEALPERWRALVMLDAFASLRWSELTALKRDDLDLETRTIRVDEKVGEVNGRLVWGTPKTRGSARVVDLPQAVIGPLAAHLLRFPPVASSVDPRCVGLIFHGDTDEPVRRKTFRRVWLKALREAGIEEHVRPGWLRHSGASLAYAATRDALAVAQRLGHTSTRMVDAVYVELYSEISRDVADAIDKLVAAADTGQMRDGTSSSTLTEGHPD